MFCRKTALWTAALTLVLTTSFIQADETYQVTLERGVKAKMRDGVVLSADIYRPKSDGKFPVLLQRTPYDKRGGVEFGFKAAAHVSAHRWTRADIR